MPKLVPALALACGLLAPYSVVAQVVPPTEPAKAAAEQDAGVLQAELARVEAERQRLEDQLAGGEPQRLQQLEEENQTLRLRLEAAIDESTGQREEERQRWFMSGGGTVGISLLLGLVIGKLGGGRRRREWLN